MPTIEKRVAAAIFAELRHSPEERFEDMDMATQIDFERIAMAAIDSVIAMKSFRPRKYRTRARKVKITG